MSPLSADLTQSTHLTLLEVGGVKLHSAKVPIWQTGFCIRFSRPQQGEMKNLLPVLEVSINLDFYSMPRFVQK